jgi:outer membrane immunogenic protein
MRTTGLIAFAAATASVIAGTNAALASDLPPRGYTKAPAIASAAYDWSGFYVGLNVGGAWERDSGISDFLSPGGRDLETNPQTNALRSSAIMGGVHAGYNWQMAKWVFGVEVDWDWTNLKNGFCRQTDSFSLACFDNGRGFVTLNEKTEWLGSARGRLGYAWDRVLIYGTGGAAWGKIDTSINANCLAAGCGTSGIELNSTASFSNTNVGWVAGAGVEAMLNPNWIVRAEYLHYDLGDVTNTLNLVSNAGPQSATWSRSFRYDTVRAGLSYKFGGLGIAKY